MADDPVAIREILRYPWVRLVRAVGVALDAKKLLLAALGLVLMHAGWAGLDALLPGSADVSPPVGVELPPSPFEAWPDPRGVLATAATLVADPPRTITAPFVA